jgi:hypothetical protein
VKQRLIIILAVVLLGAILIGLNAASYTQKPKEADNELQPNRSSYNSGATGTQAFYSLLAETGRKVVRWQEPPDDLATAGKRTPVVFVVIGVARRQFTEGEANFLLDWVADGGRLVLIDRKPPFDLVQTTANWKLNVKDASFLDLLKIDTNDQAAMTKNIAAAKPGQPTTISTKVNAIQPSIFAADIEFSRMSEQELQKSRQSGIGTGTDTRPPAPVSSNRNAPPPSVSNKNSGMNSNSIVKSQVKVDLTPGIGEAPVAHFVTGGKNIVVDVPYGEGRIVFVSDPFMVSNGGISLVDNAQLAINLVATTDGIIAFDEYHQGFGSNNNRFVQFFAGTPVVAIFFQCLVLVGLIFYSQSRRFARPVPEFEQDRLSKLEYVSAMSEMQQRTRSFDLAIENIYRDFRRRASRLLGLDNLTVATSALAVAIAERAALDRNMVEKTLDDCDQIIFGEPTNKREVLALTKRIREFEAALGLRRRPRG